MPQRAEQLICFQALLVTVGGSELRCLQRCDEFHQGLPQQTGEKGAMMATDFYVIIHSFLFLSSKL